MKDTKITERMYADSEANLQYNLNVLQKEFNKINMKVNVEEIRHCTTT